MRCRSCKHFQGNLLRNTLYYTHASLKHSIKHSSTSQSLAHQLFQTVVYEVETDVKKYTYVSSLTDFLTHELDFTTDVSVLIDEAVVQIALLL